jgi:hypothetical protein
MPAPSQKYLTNIQSKQRKTVILKHFSLKQAQVNIKTQFVPCFPDIFADTTATFRMSYCSTLVCHNKSASHTTPLIASTLMMAVTLPSHCVPHSIRVTHWGMFLKEYYNGPKEIPSSLVMRHRNVSRLVVKAQGNGQQNAQESYDSRLMVRHRGMMSAYQLYGSGECCLD